MILRRPFVIAYHISPSESPQAVHRSLAWHWGFIFAALVLHFCPLSLDKIAHIDASTTLSSLWIPVMSRTWLLFPGPC